MQSQTNHNIYESFNLVYLHKLYVETKFDPW